MKKIYHLNRRLSKHRHARLFSHHTPFLLLLHLLQHLQHGMLGGKPDSFPALAVLCAARARQELMCGTGFRLVHACFAGSQVVLSDIRDLSVSFLVLLVVLLVPLVGMFSPREAVITLTDDVRRRRFSLNGLYGRHLRAEGRLGSETWAGTMTLVAIQIQSTAHCYTRVRIHLTISAILTQNSPLHHKPSCIVDVPIKSNKLNSHVQATFLHTTSTN